MTFEDRHPGLKGKEFKYIKGIRPIEGGVFDIEPTVETAICFDLEDVDATQLDKTHVIELLELQEAMLGEYEYGSISEAMKLDEKFQKRKKELGL